MSLLDDQGNIDFLGKNELRTEVLALGSSAFSLIYFLFWGFSLFLFLCVFLVFFIWGSGVCAGAETDLIPFT